MQQMSAADAAVVESEFQSITQTIIWLPCLEIIQLFAQELFYYLNPTPGHARMSWAWGVFWIALAAGGLVAIFATIVFVCFRMQRIWRMRVLLVCFIVPVMVLQVAIQETYYYYYPGDYPNKDRLIAFGASGAILFPVTWVLCWLICDWCECTWKGLGHFFYARLPVTDQ
ncbi:MAG TPA: hypothetical protein VLQ80_22815 [Candidatus Saccharimonadia bacterium]|nr:hypothetical protein [Candidatus Saccharimonadia bacterium]